MPVGWFVGVTHISKERRHVCRLGLGTMGACLLQAGRTTMEVVVVYYEVKIFDP
jgi:hypothetical protein